MRESIVELVVLSTISMLMCFQSAGFCAGQEPISGIEVPSIESIPPAPDGEGRAYYDAATGDVYFTVGVLAVTFSDTDGTNNGSSIDFASVNTDTPLGSLSQSFGVSFLSFSGLPAGGPYNVGQLLPADPSIRTAQQFASTYPDLIFRSGPAGEPEVLSQVNVITAIPEPACGALWLVATLGCLARRRRSVQSVRQVGTCPKKNGADQGSFLISADLVSESCFS